MKRRVVSRGGLPWLALLGVVLPGGSAGAQDESQKPSLVMSLTLKPSGPVPKPAGQPKQVLVLEVSAGGEVSSLDSKAAMSPGRELRMFLKKEVAGAEGDKLTSPPTRIAVQFRPRAEAPCSAAAEVIADCQAAGFLSVGVRLSQGAKDRLLRLEPAATLADVEPRVAEAKPGDLETEAVRELVVDIEAARGGERKGTVGRVTIAMLEGRSELKDAWAKQLAWRLKEAVEVEKQAAATSKGNRALKVSVRAAPDLNWSGLVEVVEVCEKAGFSLESVERGRGHEPE